MPAQISKVFLARCASPFAGADSDLLAMSALSQILTIPDDRLGQVPETLTFFVYVAVQHLATCQTSQTLLPTMFGSDPACKACIPAKFKREDAAMARNCHADMVNACPEDFALVRWRLTAAELKKLMLDGHVQLCAPNYGRRTWPQLTARIYSTLRPQAGLDIFSPAASLDGPGFQKRAEEMTLQFFAVARKEHRRHIEEYSEIRPHMLGPPEHLTIVGHLLREEMLEMAGRFAAEMGQTLSADYCEIQWTLTFAELEMLRLKVRCGAEAPYSRCWAVEIPTPTLRPESAVRCRDVEGQRTEPRSTLALSFAALTARPSSGEPDLLLSPSTATPSSRGTGRPLPRKSPPPNSSPPSLTRPPAVAPSAPDAFSASSYSAAPLGLLEATSPWPPSISPSSLPPMSPPPPHAAGPPLDPVSAPPLPPPPPHKAGPHPEPISADRRKGLSTVEENPAETRAERLRFDEDLITF